MRYAIFSDVHSNWEALTVFLDYTRRQRIDKYWMLGDIVGYGPNPEEVLAKVIEISDVVISGNHDKAVWDDSLLEWFNDEAKEAILWTRRKLSPESVGRLKALPMTHIEGSATLVHSSPADPEEFPYIYDRKGAMKAFPRFTTPLCFIGHTHVPQLFSEKEKTTGYLKEGAYSLKKDDRYIISSGSIGQPRDYDRRLCFSIFDDELWTIEIVRLDYPAEETAQKIIAVGLPKFFAERLL